MRSCRPFCCGLPGALPLRRNPGLDHENRKAGQPSTPGGGERRTVVGAQPERQAEFAEGRIEHRPDVLGVAPGQRLTAQQIAAVRVGERQRFATGPVAGDEPALKMDAPHVVGRAAMAERRARGRAAAAQLALHRQPFAIEQEADRARRRPVDRRRLPLEKGAHLQRPPGRMRPAHRNAALADLSRNRLRVMARRPRANRANPRPPPPDNAKAVRSPSSGSRRTPGRAQRTAPRASRPQSQSASSHPRCRSPSIPSARPSSPIS